METSINRMERESHAPIGANTERTVVHRAPARSHPYLARTVFVFCACSSSLHIAREILDAEGLRGLYKGFGVTLCSAMPFTAILWSVTLVMLCHESQPQALDYVLLTRYLTGWLCAALAGPCTGRRRSCSPRVWHLAAPLHRICCPLPTRASTTSSRRRCHRHSLACLPRPPAARSLRRLIWIGDACPRARCSRPRSCTTCRPNSNTSSRGSDVNRHSQLQWDGSVMQSLADRAAQASIQQRKRPRDPH